MEFGICCDVEMWVDRENSELVCKSCGRVETIMGVPFNEHQFFDQSQKGQPPPSAKKNNSTHLRKKLEELKIFDAVSITGQGENDPKQYRFLDALINDFRDGGKSVNYVCFLYDYFEGVSSDAWPQKEEIFKLLSPHLPKIRKTHWHAKARFSEWWGKTNRGEAFI